MIDGGDERAQELYKKYNQYMPAFTMLDDQQIEHILGFIHIFHRGRRRVKTTGRGGRTESSASKNTDGDLCLVLEEVLTLPASDTIPSLARINNY